MASRKLWVIFGPTASGKSALARRIAQNSPAVILNADSQQLYRELRVVTARPSVEEESEIPHALYGVVPAAESASVGRWLDMAVPAIEAAWTEGRLPLVVGGTGMYVRALLEGIAEIPDVSPAVRARIAARFDHEGEAPFRDALMRADPDAAARIKPGDRQRLIRAMEVWEATGTPLTDWQNRPTHPPFPDAEVRKIAVTLPRDTLYARCDARFDCMLEEGAVEEVRDLLALGLDPALPAMRAVGVPELGAYLRGEWSLEEAALKAKQATRNYAKRQLTWLRNQYVADETVENG